ncbi:hypothetical protein GRS96_01755 [Rathayibacter sp. VKM Ac-2803]|uniref:hypothetical protein n=1 Tax=unclassified Rathayibacter TaxID=2609250 RepID=UPI00135AAFA6|nr:MULTISPECIES: hypothetical protein [unclassified Rathayibacter]MWV47997.1 hypothetical protein [Rathayibacter sp. VKM Ac-2803]MWV58778.1 hypothetical protein [Rathayibacter sp. VKM Ac-2754]
MRTRRLLTTGAAALLAGLALSGCTAPQEGAAEATPTALPTTTPTASPTPAERPLGPVTVPEGATAAVRWTDQIGAPEPQTVRLTGEPLTLTISVACDTADAAVTVEIDGLMTSGSTCYYSPSTTRGSGGGGNGASMDVAVDQDALITVTTEPADARWSGAVSTGPAAAG